MEKQIAIVVMAVQSIGGLKCEKELNIVFLHWFVYGVATRCHSY